MPGSVSPMSDAYLERPAQTRRTYKVCSDGPVDIYYIPNSGVRQDSRYAFQIFSCWKPLLCSTAKCFTKVICQSDVPVFVPETADVFVDGKDVSIYAPISALVHLPENDDERIQTRPTPDITVPKKVGARKSSDGRRVIGSSNFITTLK
ncbi:hypothetical protein GCK32_014264 [Trichostrongylus colubriformis]|uniref:Uncharacterized protein n=1 Tax=Trichostrongylus colubriformis TaxID=6319 RepID=A0AAN8G8G3_TRICO